MAWCAGGWSIWRNASSRSSASPSPSRRSAGSCAPWAIASCQPARAIMPRRRVWSRLLKKLPRVPGYNRARESDRQQQDRNLVLRRGAYRPVTRRWAKRGTRPSAPRDQRTASTYIFGAVCPKQGKGAALILPACNTETMNLHLAEIALTESATEEHALRPVRRRRLDS